MARDFDLSDNLGRRLAMAYRGMVRRVGKALEPHGLGSGQYPYLFNLYVNDGQTQQMLADNFATDKAGVLRAIARLEKLGYVKREPDAKDRRAMRVWLTPKARAVRPKIEAIVKKVLGEMQKGLTATEVDTAMRVLERVAENGKSGG